MKILHYSLGFPPFRTGGMTKYCMDLMAEQIRQGHNVSLLWPGKLVKPNQCISVIKRGKYLFSDKKISVQSFEMRNPLPVPLLNGIRNIDYFIQSKDIKVLIEFLKEYQFDILHVHTLMGLPREMLDACRDLNVKTFFTTHDYFGICPKWGLERNGVPCVDDHKGIDCISCNENALSFKKMSFLQSSLYRILKDSPIFRLLRKVNNSSIYSSRSTSGFVSVKDKGKAYEYQVLRKFYVDLLERFDLLLFNSFLTRDVYSRYCSVLHGCILPITHGEIEDHRIFRSPHVPLRFGYLGPVTRHKGFFMLIDACNKLWRSNTNTFELHIYSDYKGDLPYLRKHRPYQYIDLPKVMNQFDILVVPSRWYETFGFTVLEALSYGIPVIVTENVGAKEIVNNTVGKRCGVICFPSNEALFSAMKKIVSDSETVVHMNKSICRDLHIQTIQEHVSVLNSIYESPSEYVGNTFEV